MDANASFMLFVVGVDDGDGKGASGWIRSCQFYDICGDVGMI